MKSLFSLLPPLLLLLPTLSRLEAEPLIVAHRGASHDAPENTIPAFELAWKQGADAIEGDFRLTRDGEIVCIHDRHTGRIANRKLVVAESTLAQLKELDVGSWKGKRWRGTRIPTIAEVFATVPDDKLVYVEIKSGPAIVPKLLAEVERSGLETDQLVVISFDDEVIRTLESHAPQFATCWLSGFKKDASGRIEPSPAETLATLRRIRADGFSSTHKHIDQPYIERIRKAGYDYHVWTVDDVATARKFAAWGAKSITTNRPGDLRKRLTRKDERPAGDQ